MVIIRFRVQFGINLHDWIFQKAEIAQAASANAFSAFWKTHKCRLNSKWTKRIVSSLIYDTNLKFERKTCWKMFLEAIYSHLKTFFHCFTYHWPTKISHCLFANHNSELRYVICAHATLFVLVFHFLDWCYTWTALLSANQNRVIFFFMCIIFFYHNNFRKNGNWKYLPKIAQKR